MVRIHFPSKDSVCWQLALRHSGDKSRSWIATPPASLCLSDHGRTEAVNEPGENLGDAQLPFVISWKRQTCYCLGPFAIILFRIKLRFMRISYQLRMWRFSIMIFVGSSIQFTELLADVIAITYPNHDREIMTNYRIVLCGWRVTFFCRPLKWSLSA